MYIVLLEFFFLLYEEKEVDRFLSIDCCLGSRRLRGDLCNVYRVGFIYKFNEISCNFFEINGNGNVLFCI